MKIVCLLIYNQWIIGPLSVFKAHMLAYTLLLTQCESKRVKLCSVHRHVQIKWSFGRELMLSESPDPKGKHGVIQPHILLSYFTNLGINKIK